MQVAMTQPQQQLATVREAKMGNNEAQVQAAMPKATEKAQVAVPFGCGQKLNVQG